uniref:Uncharacterized protein n=1 Tax=mine drainage metagenome TaxID=410659 RepID=E6PYK2_9ZZZZ
MVRRIRSDGDAGVAVYGDAESVVEAEQPQISEKVHWKDRKTHPFGVGFLLWRVALWRELLEFSLFIPGRDVS